MKTFGLFGRIMLGVLILASGRRIAAQEEPPKEEPKSDPAMTAKRLEELKRAAESYRIETDTDPPLPLVLKSEPILRWTNPLRKTDDGAVFLWTANGRPEVVASFYRYRYEGVIHEDHEFQSLAMSGLSAVRAGRVVWTPRTAGVALKPIPGAAPPAPTPAERLRQMRALAREFHAFFDLPENQSELRLLTQPMYRFETTNRPDVLDGALFAFVQTTDPEVLLLIESRPVGDKPVWHYGLARMSMVNLRAKHKDLSVWNVDWEPKFGNPSLPYSTLPGAEPTP